MCVMRTPRCLIVALLAVAVGVASASAPAQAQPSDADFLAARTAFERGQRDRLEALAPRLDGHLLQPYVDTWRLRLGLDTATDDEVLSLIHI